MLTICLLGGTVVKLRNCAQEMSHVHMYIYLSSIFNIGHKPFLLGALPPMLPQKKQGLLLV